MTAPVADETPSGGAPQTPRSSSTRRVASYPAGA
jgi:hypothetical protein